MSENLAKEPEQDTTESGAEAKTEKSTADALYDKESNDAKAKADADAKADSEKVEGDGQSDDETQKEPEENKDKQETDKEEENKVPEKYELKVPEGSQLNKDDIEEIESYAKDQGFSNEQAQKLVDRDFKNRARFVESQQAQLQETTQQWGEQVKTDKEIGGEKFNESVSLAKQVLKRFGSDELRTQLDKTGFGNHPELVRVFSRIGRSMDSDKLMKTGDAPARKKSIEEVFYGENS